MILSASYRTDVPAFYPDWFIQRLRQGFCHIQNPRTHSMWRINLSPTNIDGIVFWTKNASPILPHLDEIKDMGLPFMFQFSLTAYSTHLPALEPRVPTAFICIDAMHQLAEKYGPQVPVWRYDPIIFTNKTTEDFHLDNFRSLAAALAGATNCVVISFCQMYPKTKRNLTSAARQHNFRWEDPSPERKLALGQKLTKIAGDFGISLYLCSQGDLLGDSLPPASCVDAKRLSVIAGKTIKAELKPNRPACKCYKSTDIGAYQTCAHGCAYCYAVDNHERALANQQGHTTLNTSLVPMAA